jgi:sporulation protein YlmC with PRC-barrel domain
MSGMNIANIERCELSRASILENLLLTISKLRGESYMKRVTSLIRVFILLVLVSGTSIYAQQQNPSSQPEKVPEQKATEQETTTTSTSTSDNATQQEIKNYPSAGTASTLQGLMLASDTIIGASVKNEEEQEIGKIERLHISPKYGVVMYAELSVGGFLGMGEKTIMVPWKSIEIARSGDSLVINTPKQMLKKLPE